MERVRFLIREPKTKQEEMGRRNWRRQRMRRTGRKREASQKQAPKRTESQKARMHGR